MTQRRVHNFTDRSTIESEASEWLARLDSDEPVSRDQFEQLCEWVRRSPAHREALDRLSVVWDQMDALSALAVPLGRANISPLAIVGKLVGGLCKPRFALAAVSVALVVAIIVFAQGRVTDPRFGVGNGEYVTDIGEIRTLDLADGSTIQLNTNSKVDVDWSAGERAVFLSFGEAHFDVAPDAGKRFVVYTAVGAVEAVGTAFQVRVLPGEVEVTVTEGVVDLRGVEASGAGISAGASAQALPMLNSNLGQLRAWQSIRFDGRTRKVGQIQTLGASEVAVQLSWREGQLMFAGETLAEVVSEVSRYTELDVVIADPEIEAIRIGGRFKIGETDALFEVLQASFDVDVKWVNPTRVELHSAAI